MDARPTTELDGIEHLILLDLLGAPKPVISSYFLDTAWLFDAMVSVERRLGDSGAFNTAPGKWKSYFRPRTRSTVDFISDDHVPFLKRGVSVLHIISVPYPLVWHTLAVCLIILTHGY
jgi:glutaminyl-peptide cyclotransferase